MPRGKDSSKDARRLVGRPKPTPFFRIGDSAQAVASDWSTSTGRGLRDYARTGRASAEALQETENTLSSVGGIEPTEKERLINLGKHLRLQLEEE